MFYSLHTLSKNLTCFSGTMTCCFSYYQTQDGCLREPFLRLTPANHFYFLKVKPDFNFYNSYRILSKVLQKDKNSNQNLNKKVIIKVFCANNYSLCSFGLNFQHVSVQQDPIVPFLARPIILEPNVWIGASVPPMNATRNQDVTKVQYFFFYDFNIIFYTYF